MKTAIAIMVALALVSILGCQTSVRGGSVLEDEGFRIGVPTFNSEVKQGELRIVTISLLRDARFKQDVDLVIKGARGINVEPTSVTLKANEKPEVQLQISAEKDAALGEYPVVVTGTPDKGEKTAVGFTVKVVAP